MDKLLQSDPAETLPSPSLVRRYFLALDMSLCLAMRKRHDHRLVRRYGHADSSPLGGFDWLWTQAVEVDECALLRTFIAINKLTVAIDKWWAEEEPLHDEGDDAWRKTPPPSEWQPWLRTIKDDVFMLIDTPTALGSGHRGAADKAANMVSAWSLHTPASQTMSNVAESYRSMTTDMGVEMAVADFCIADPSRLLPEWVQRGPMGNESDTDPSVSADGHYDRLDLSDPDPDGAAMTPERFDDDSDSDVAIAQSPQDTSGAAAVQPERVEGEPQPPSVSPAGEAPPLSPRSPLPMPARDKKHAAAAEAHFLPRSWTIGGLQHITSNLSRDIHTLFTHWKTFFQSLKNLEALLKVKERRSRYVQRCLRGSSLSHLEKKFERFPFSLYEAPS